jgi:tetratricopeptide (TPR) repeat protein
VLLGLAIALCGVPEGLGKLRHPAKQAGAPEGKLPKVAAPMARPPEDGTQVRLQAAAAAQQAGRLDEALAALEKLYLDERTPAALLQLGHIARQQGRVVAAADLLRRYLDSLTATPDDRVAEELRQLLSGLTEPVIEASVVGVRGWALRVDDRIVGTLPLPGPVMLPPGAHRLVVEHASKTTPSAAIELPADQQVEISLSISPQQELTPAVSVIPTVVVLVDGQTEAWAAVREPSDSQRLLDAIRTALSAKRTAAVRADRQSEALWRPELARCEPSLACQAELGLALKATYVLSFTLPSGPGRAGGEAAGSGLSARILDVRTRQVAAERSIDCPSCTAPVRVVRIGTTVYELLATALSRPRGILSITWEPPGAALQINGEPRGLAPLRQEVFAGVYEVVAEQKGFLPSKASVEVRPGQSATAQLRLASAGPAAPASRVPAREPARPSAAGGRPLWRLVSGSALLGAGVILVGFGGSALAVNGRCKSEPAPSSADPLAPCAPVYETAGVGGGLVGAGAGAVLGGVLLIAWP